jgi:excinuclease UvrABC nuclease subunit
VFRDGRDQPLYVGKARNLRARLRSYFSGERQRPAVEAALAALAAIQWTACGSELEAALRELQLLRAWRPPANARATRPDRYVYLQRAGSRWRVVSEPTPFGPLKSRRTAQRAVRALDGHDGDDPRKALIPLRERMRRLARAQRFEDAARLRDRIGGLEEALAAMDELARLRGIRLCLLAPARERGFVHGFFVAQGRVAAERLLPLGGGALVEARAGIAEALRAEESLRPEHADELVVVGQLLRRPPPEVRVCPLEAEAIVRAAHGVPLAA